MAQRSTVTQIQDDGWNLRRDCQRKREGDRKGGIKHRERNERRKASENRLNEERKLVKVKTTQEERMENRGDI